MAKASQETKAEKPIALKGYIIGFTASLVLTLIAYVLTSIHVGSNHDSLPHQVLVPTLGVLALSQFVVQAIYFLHLSADRRPYWKVIAFWFMLLVVFILVVGSLWIMQNLNYNMMSPTETQDYMQKHQGF